MNKCIDCGREINKEAKRCGSCAKNGKNNPNYKNGAYIGSIGKNYCLDCGKEINKRSKRCQSCANKELLNRPEIKQKLSKARKGKNHPSYIDGRSLGFIKNYCLDCGEKIDYRSKRCQSCEMKLRCKNGIYNSIYDNRSICYPNIKYKKKDGTFIYLDSSWELKVAQNLDKNNINWLQPNSRNDHIFQWIDKNGNQHIYYPDFYLLDCNIYLDPKNSYLRKLSEDKINRVKKQNNIKILILDKNELDWKNIKILIKNGD